MKNKNLDEIPLEKMSKPMRELYTRSRGIEVTGAPPVPVPKKRSDKYRVLDKALVTLRNKSRRTIFMLSEELGVTGRRLLEIEKHETELTVELLKSYAKACGGKLTISVELDNGKKHKLIK